MVFMFCLKCLLVFNCYYMVYVYTRGTNIIYTCSIVISMLYALMVVEIHIRKAILLLPYTYILYVNCYNFVYCT